MSTANTDIVNLDSIAGHHLGETHLNLSTAALVEEVLRRREGHRTDGGGVAIRHGLSSERSLDTMYVLAGSTTEADWLLGGRYVEIDAARLDRLSSRLQAYLQGRDVFVQDLVVGEADGVPRTCRVVTETAWHALLTRALYRPANGDAQEPELLVIHAPGFGALSAVDGITDGPFTIFQPDRGLAYIGGSAYGGELRQAIMSLARLETSAEVLPLWGAASVDAQGEAALFLGRTGTGKTALALDTGRRLVTDHAVGWSDAGLRGYERGAYASVLALDPVAEPAVHRGTERVGSVLENVCVEVGSRRPDFADARLAVNTRAAIRLDAASEKTQACDHPRHLFLLTRDTAGVLPPIARLTPEQAVFAFLISYTSSLADTEAGLRDVRPDVEAALGEASVAVSPAAYAKRFMERIVQHGVTCWFVNTGWVGEPADRGQRVALDVTRALVRAALSGALRDVEMESDPLFLFDVPRTCPGVDPALLNPRELAEDPAEYEIRANLVATAFIDAFTHFEEEMPASVAAMVDSVVLFEETLDVMENFRFSF